MDNKKDNIDKIESISTIIVNIGTIVSWGLTIFTAFVLTTQSQPISLPGFIELNASYKLLFLLSILLGYIQLLRKQWENQKRVAKEIEGSFGSYLFGSLIRFKRPMVFIGFLVILSIMGILISTEMIELGFVFIFLGVPIILTFFLSGGAEWVQRQFDDEFRNKWLKRVRNQLYQNGYTSTTDFKNLPVKHSEINWALELYFNRYEFEQELILTQRKMKKDLTRYTLNEIGFKHVPSHLSEQDREE